MQHPGPALMCLSTRLCMQLFTRESMGQSTVPKRQAQLVAQLQMHHLPLLRNGAAATSPLCSSVTLRGASSCSFSPDGCSWLRVLACLTAPSVPARQGAAATRQACMSGRSSRCTQRTTALACSGISTLPHSRVHSTVGRCASSAQAQAGCGARAHAACICCTAWCAGRNCNLRHAT